MRTRLKKARKDLNLTQAEFAESLGMTTTSYNYLENGKTPLQDKHIKAICAIFDINEDWLRFNCGEEFNNSGLTREILRLSDKLLPSNQKEVLDFAKFMYDKQVDEYDPRPTTTSEPATKDPPRGGIWGE